MSSFLRLIVRNALRNRRRTLLTGMSVALSLFLLVSLQTLLVEIKGDTMLTKQSERRLLTRSAVSLDVPLPVAYKAKIARVPGVEVVSEYQWIPTYYKNRSDLAIIVACDPDVIGTDPDIIIAPDAVEAFRADRNATLVPLKMARKYGWKAGDRVTFPGTAFPYNLELRICGTYKTVAQNALFCHFALFNELTRQHLPAQADKTMAFIMRTRSPEAAPEIGARIDAMFRNSAAPTRTESERAFVLGFSAMLGNVRVFISMIAAAVIFAIALVTTNTMSMAIRERTQEIAMLKTLGFTPARVLALIVAESLAISAAGGAAGIVAARLFFVVFDIYDLTNGIIQHFQITDLAIAQGAALAFTMGIVSAIVPAWRGTSRPIAAGLREMG